MANKAPTTHFSFHTHGVNCGVVYSTTQKLLTFASKFDIIPTCQTTNGMQTSK